MTALESNIQKKIIKYIVGIPGCFCYKASDKYICGIPDIICCIYGRFIAFEVKRPGTLGSNTHRKLQGYVRAKIKASGGYAYEVCSLDEVKGIIDGLIPLLV